MSRAYQVENALLKSQVISSDTYSDALVLDTFRSASITCNFSSSSNFDAVVSVYQSNHIGQDFVQDEDSICPVTEDGNIIYNVETKFRYLKIRILPYTGSSTVVIYHTRKG